MTLALSEQQYSRGPRALEPAGPAQALLSLRVGFRSSSSRPLRFLSSPTMARRGTRCNTVFAVKSAHGADHPVSREPSSHSLTAAAETLQTPARCGGTPGSPRCVALHDSRRVPRPLHLHSMAHTSNPNTGEIDNVPEPLRHRPGEVRRICGLLARSLSLGRHPHGHGFLEFSSFSQVVEPLSTPRNPARISRRAGPRRSRPSPVPNPRRHTGPCRMTYRSNASPDDEAGWSSFWILRGALGGLRPPGVVLSETQPQQRPHFHPLLVVHLATTARLLFLKMRGSSRQTSPGHRRCGLAIAIPLHPRSSPSQVLHPGTRGAGPDSTARGAAPRRSPLAGLDSSLLAVMLALQRFTQ